MAAFHVIGFINTIKYLSDACLVFIDDSSGWLKIDTRYLYSSLRKDSGFNFKESTYIVEDKYISWKIIYKGYFKKYINTHFNNGMLVEVKGDIRPYAIEKEKIIDGYSVIGETINIYSYPRASVKQEQRMVKDSQLHASGTPDLEAFNRPDF